MNTRAIATEYRMQQWAAAIHERVTSAESIGAFCEARGISRNTYFYWQRKLREAASGLAAQSAESGKALVPHGWARCEETAPETKNKSLTIEIGSYRVQVEPDTDPELLG